LCSHSKQVLIVVGLLQVHSLLEQHEQSLVHPITPAVQPLPQQSVSAVEEPPHAPSPLQQLPEEQLHMENMGYDLVSPIFLLSHLYYEIFVASVYCAFELDCIFLPT
jgi:hypothetical protein